MTEPLVKVKNLSRSFTDVKAVDGLSFQIARGSVVGFIGANGAGKTTTMRMMATLDQPDGGSISIGGVDVVNEPMIIRKSIGWMPDAYGRYDHVTCVEYLDFFCRAFGYRGKERESRIEEILDFTNLRPLADRQMGKLSKGMGQRLCLGRTLLHDPDLLILDEPAAGLDPKARQEFKRLVRLLAEDGKTIFISSHILSELEEMCDSLLFIDSGRLVHEGSADTLKNQDGHGGNFAITIHGPVKLLVDWVRMQPGVSLIEETREGARIHVEAEDKDDVVELIRRLVKDHIPLVGFTRESVRLEDAFVDIVNKVSGE